MLCDDESIKQKWRDQAKGREGGARRERADAAPLPVGDPKEDSSEQQRHRGGTERGGHNHPKGDSDGKPTNHARGDQDHGTHQEPALRPPGLGRQEANRHGQTDLPPGTEHYSGR